MKTVIFFAMLVSLIGCRKASINSDMHQNTHVEAFLRNNMNPLKFSQLDFDNAKLIKLGSDSIQLVQVPFRSTNYDLHSVVVRMKDNICTSGKIMRLNGSINSKQLFEGEIEIWTLNGIIELRSKVENGIIQKYHPPRGIVSQRSINPDIVPHDPYTSLPEVIVIATIHTSGGVSYGTWANLLAAMSGGSGGGNSGTTGGYYSNISQSQNGSGGDGSEMDGGSAQWIDAETAIQNPRINIHEYLNCFNNIPDENATCSIEIFTDIPIDSNPLRAINWQTGFPGHTFLQIRKSNGNQSISQNIGFYPASSWKTTVTTAPIPGKFVDNALHGFNGSMKIELSPAKLKVALEKIDYLSTFVKYDVDDYNCTDFALEVLNSVRADELEIQRLGIPGAMTPFGSNTPQGLFLTLQKMKQVGGPEAHNIWVSQFQGMVGDSFGPCLK